MRFSKQLLVTGALVFGLLSCSKTNENDVIASDQTFMTQAALSNSAEIDAGTLASTNASSAEVKAFGLMMVTEHTTAQNDLKTVGTKIGLTVKDTIDPAHVALKQKLMSLSGRAFDSVYIMSQIADHQVTLANYITEINSGNNINVLNYANNYRPHIAMHYNTADSIAKAMKFK